MKKVDERKVAKIEWAEAEWKHLGKALKKEGYLLLGLAEAEFGAGCVILNIVVQKIAETPWLRDE